MKSLDEIVTELHAKGGQILIGSHANCNAVRVRLSLLDRYVETVLDGERLSSLCLESEIVLRELNELWRSLQVDWKFPTYPRIELPPEVHRGD
jgi:hypothetical protein